MHNATEKKIYGDTYVKHFVSLHLCANAIELAKHKVLELLQLQLDGNYLEP